MAKGLQPLHTDVEILPMSRPVLVVIGPSASGKSTAVRELARRGILRVHPTWTTRARRADEVEGALEHRFVSDDLFDELEAYDFFLGTVSLPGLSFRYGLPRPSLLDDGPADTIMARAPFIDLFADYFPNRIVYQVEDSIERAYARLVERGSSADEINARLVGHSDEIDAGHRIAQRVFVNADFDALVSEMARAIEADFARSGVQR